MDARNQLDKHTGAFSDAYSQLETAIFQRIVKVLKDGLKQDVNADNVIEWQAQQLAKMGQLNRSVVELMAQYDGLDADNLFNTLKADGFSVIDEIDGKLGKTAPVSKELANTLDSVLNQATGDLNNVINQSLLSRNYSTPACQTYQRILTESTAQTVSGVKSHNQAVMDAVYKAVDQGLTVLTDRAGRHWSVEGYSKTVLTTTANRVYNDLRTKRMQELGQTLAVMSAHPNARPACAYIQGHIVNVVSPESPGYNPKYDSIYSHGYGTPAGTLGINCRHVLTPYTPEINTNKQPQYDPKEAIKRGNLQQQQRAYERAIRQAKKRLQIATELGDDVTASRTKTLLAARQARLREFIKETNKGQKVPVLARDYAREQVAPNTAKQVPKLSKLSDKASGKRYNVLYRKLPPGIRDESDNAPTPEEFKEMTKDFVARGGIIITEGKAIDVLVIRAETPSIN